MKEPGRIAVINAGASTLKLALMEVAEGKVSQRQRLQREWTGTDDSGEILDDALRALEEVPDAFGYRVVHGGDGFKAPTLVTPEVAKALEALIPLAPLHNGPALAAMRAVGERFPQLPGVAVFDTAFHARRPAVSVRYPLPDDLVETFGMRRYGFHGIAHASLVEGLAAAEDIAADQVTAVTLQLGAGCSACAVDGGRSLETSMGYTPLEGLVMGTRCGDVDPAVVIRLMRAGYDADWIEEQLTRHSGLVGLCGSSDMREILAAAQRGESAAVLALDLFCYRLVLTVGAYLTLLGGRGAVVFGGGIGTHAPEIRRRVTAGLAAWDVVLDDVANRRNEPGRISEASHRGVFALPTNEEAVIAREVAAHL